MPKSIPDRWIPYKACGDIIEGTRIICFKVPLHKRVQEAEPAITEIWDIPTVLEEIPKLGAVIDLTNTARYYNPRVSLNKIYNHIITYNQEFEKANVLHKKIFMPGREIPPPSKVLEFMDAVDEFLGKDCDQLIGVHCTHGLNRTGYMVCRYMRDRLNIPAEEAIKRFQAARGYKIEREIYTADLLNKTLPPSDIDRNYSQRRDQNISRPEANHRSKVTNNLQHRHGNSRCSQHPPPDANSEPNHNDTSRKKRKRSKNRSRRKNKDKNQIEPKPKKRKIFH